MNLKRILATLRVQTPSSARPIIAHSIRALRAITLIVAVTLAASIARAQADFEKGYQAFQSYHGSDFDSVNLANGNLVLNIPLLSYEQRGGVPPVTISIRSNSTTFQSTPPLTGGPADTNQHEVTSGVIGAPWGQPHVLISPGGLFWKEERIVTSAKTAIGPEYLVRFVAIDDSGATHSLGGGIANSTAGYVPGIKYSVDGSGLMLQPGTTVTGPVLVDRKGNTGGLVDPNGNAITLKGTCATAPGSGDFFNAALPFWEGYAHGTASSTSIVDTLGRVIPNPSYLPTVENYSCLVDVDASYHPATTTPDPGYAAGGICHIFPTSSPLTYQEMNYTPQYYGETFQYPGEGNANNVPLTFCYAQIPVSGSIPQVNGANLESETINEKWWALTSVTLPNGTFWQFGYDNYGQVQTVIMPTGAMVTYQYAWRLACGNPPGQIPVVGTPVWPYSNILSSRMVSQRNVYLNSTDSTPTEVWQYSNNIGSGWIGAPPAGTLGIVSPGGPNQGTATVTDPIGNLTAHTFSLIGGSTCGPWETKTQYFQGASALLKEVDTTYSNTGTDYANPTNFSNYIALGVFPSTVTTTLPSNGSPLVSYDVSQYDTFGSYQDYTGITHQFSFGQVRSSTESDFNSATPLRTTLHTKLWQSNWNYYAKNLIDLPSLDTVLGPTGIQAQTSYAYDEPGYVSGTTWGLQTSANRWLNTNGSWVSTHNNYGPEVTGPNCTNTSAYIGMPTKKIDAKGYITTLTYDCYGLYLSKILYPDNSSESPSYDDNTGLLLSYTDQNTETTHYTYDTMRRLTEVTYPSGGGWETLVYNDTPRSLSVTFTKAITQPNPPCVPNSSGCLTKVAYADGLGRLTQTQLTSDPYGTVYTDTTYDSLGRVASVSNPYRSTSEATYGITRYTYDALSRKAMVTAPDGTKKQACFNGINTVGQSNCHGNGLGNVGVWEDDADENQNDWQRTQNALGQMTHVLEPNGTGNSPSMETDYFYDVLNNLLAVDQWGGSNGTSPGERRARTFTYDSLSRLLSSSNPETGMSLYAYDANSNVISRTDARNVTTSYQYDQMNRLYCKSYSVASSTPSSWYLYGLPSGLSSVPNGIGRLINAWTQSASAGVCPTTPPTPSTGAPAAGFLTMRAIGGYDSMGRITSEQQNTLATVANGAPYALSYSYDLAGDLATSTNGIGPATTGTQAGTPFIFSNTYDGAGRLQSLASNWTTNYVTGAANILPQALFNAQTGTAACPNSSSPQAAYSAFGGLQNAVFGKGLVLNRSYDNRLRTTCEMDTGGIVANSTPGSATVTITGLEQSK
jgi:YD repeat-containing protein